eukprot:6931834-Lingulodinium_polyedra.AAC.1
MVLRCVVPSQCPAPACYTTSRFTVYVAPFSGSLMPMASCTPSSPMAPVVPCASQAPLCAPGALP